MNDEDKFAGELVPIPDDKELALPGQRHAPPALVTDAGQAAAFAYAEFFGATIQNPNTYKAYRHAVDTFLAWCEQQGLALAQVSPMLVSAYIRDLSGSIPKKKLHLSALRHFFDQLVVRHAVAFNPALSVRAPQYTNVEGKTPPLIRSRWDDMVRVAGSLKLGWVTASLFISKLQAYPRRNALALALQEYGRLIKTIFILRYLEDEAYRRRINRQLNKGEALHMLREFLFFANKGTIRHGCLPVEESRHLGRRRVPDTEGVARHTLSVLAAGRHVSSGRDRKGVG